MSGVGRGLDWLVRSRLGILTLASVLAIALVGTVVLARIPDRRGRIHGCYDERTGDLRVINAPRERCTSRERALTWNRTGPQGPPGPSGFNRDAPGSVSAIRVSLREPRCDNAGEPQGRTFV